MLNGLQQAYEKLILPKISELESDHLEEIIQEYRKYVWNNLTKLAKIEDIDRILNVLDYFNPESKSICLILWVLSSNPHYMELINKCIQTKSLELIQMLGPAILVLYWTT